MSATGRGRDRNAADFYPTPDDYVRAVVSLLPLHPTDRVLDPCVGDAVWPVALHEAHGVVVDAGDLYPERYRGLRAACEAGAVGHVHRGRFQRFDARHARVWPYDWVVSNPPYALAEEFVRHALFAVRPGGWVAYVLRHGFPATKVRREFTRAYPPCLTVLAQERPSFTGDGKTDASEYSVFFWRRGWPGPRTGRAATGLIEYLSYEGDAQQARDVAKIRALLLELDAEP